VNQVINKRDEFCDFFAFVHSKIDFSLVDE